MTYRELNRTDPALSRSLVAIEHRVEGHYATVFQTTDNRAYVRNLTDNTIHRAIQKVRGKSARRADKKARHAST